MALKEILGLRCLVKRTPDSFHIKVDPFWMGWVNQRSNQRVVSLRKNLEKEHGSVIIVETEIPGQTLGT